MATIDLNSLVVLRALLTERHVTRAAAKVGLSQSATSHALARLRELYADPLLVRSGRELVPTPRAVALLPTLERALDEIHATVRGAATFEPLRARRKFVLAAADYSLAVTIAPLLQQLAREAPGIEIDVTSHESLLERLEHGEVDMAFVVDPRDRRGLMTKRLFTDGFLCTVRREHPAVKSRLTMSTYLALEHLLIAPSGTPGSIVDSRLAERGHSRHVAVRISSFLAAPYLVCGSDMVNTGPARLARLWAARFPVRVFPAPIPLPTFDIYLAWNVRHDNDAAHAWLRALIDRVTKTG